MKTRELPHALKDWSYEEVKEKRMIDRKEVERVANYLERYAEIEPAQMLRDLLAERESFYMEYRMKCDAETKELLVRAEKAEIALDAEQRHSQLMRERVTKAEAERDELKETQLKFGTMMHEVMAERDDLQKKLDTCLQGGMRVWAERAEKAEAERDAAFAEIARLVDQCRAVDQLRVEANALWAEELDKAIKHCEAMESWTTYEEWGRAADAFRKWMEERE